MSWSELAGGLPRAVVLAAVESVDPGGLSGTDLVDAIVASERLLSHMQGLQAGLLAALCRPGAAGDLTTLVAALTQKAGRARGAGGEVDPELLAALVGEQAQALAATEVAAALCIPHRTASERVGRAVELVDRLPLTWRALSEGRIDARRAGLIAEATRDLPADLRAAVEKVIVPLAGSRVSGRVKELLDRAVLAADPDAAASRERTARAGRSVAHYAGSDGVGVIHARLTAEGASAVFTLLDLLAQHGAGGRGVDGRGIDGRGIDARRADALTDMCTELLDCGHLDLTGTCATGPAADDGHDVADTGRSAAGAGSPAGCCADPENPATAEGSATGGAAGAGCSDPVARPDFVDVADRADVADRSERPDPATSNFVEPTAGTSADAGDGADVGGVAAAGDSAAAGNCADVGGPAAVGGRVAGSLWRGLARHGRRPHLSVTVALSTLAGLDRLPGHLAGHGAITAELAKNLAAAYGTVTLIGVDPGAGTAAAVSATVYRPRQATADQVIAAAGTCVFPSCRMPAWRCDIDHVVPFVRDDSTAGGRTDADNCSPECRRHHLLKTHAHWRVENLPDRTMAWVSPTGHRYVDRPREFALPDEATHSDVATLVHPATAPLPGRPPPVGWSPPDDPDAEGHPGEPSSWRPPIGAFVVASNADPVANPDPGRRRNSGSSGDPGGLGQSGCASDPGDLDRPIDVLLRVRAIQRAQDRSTALARLRHLNPVTGPAPSVTKGAVAVGTGAGSGAVGSGTASGAGQEPVDPALIAVRLCSLLAHRWTRTGSIHHPDTQDTDPHVDVTHHGHPYHSDPPALRPTGTDDTPPF